MRLTENKILNNIKLFFLTVISSTRLMIVIPMFICLIIYQVDMYMETKDPLFILIISISILMIFSNAIIMEQLRWKGYTLNITMLDRFNSIYIPSDMSINIVLFGFVAIIVYAIIFVVSNDLVYLYMSILTLWTVSYNIWSLIKYNNIKKQSSNIIRKTLGKDALTIEWKHERGVFYEFSPVAE